MVNMYQTEATLREERTRRLLYLLFGVSMIVSVAICGTILFFMLSPVQGKRLVGRDADFAAGEVAEVPVKQLELSKLLPNSPQWSEDIVFVVKQGDASYQAFLGLDPQSACKLNWRAQERQFVDRCSQATYSISGRNDQGVATLAARPQHMIELPVEVADGNVYVLDQLVRRDLR